MCSRSNKRLISTHAPLARRDTPFFKMAKTINKFLLTRLSRGATDTHSDFTQSFVISTHAPLARRDLPGDTFQIDTSISTHAPLARRDGHRSAYARAAYISTHAPLARRDNREFGIIVGQIPFLLTRLSRGATATISSMIAVPHHISLEADFFSHSYHIFMPENRIFGY